MAIFWSYQKPLPVGEVVRLLQRNRDLAYTTVLTVINRLAVKGLLVRAAGQVHHYQAVFTPEQFFRSAAETFFGQMRRQFGPVAVACFAEELQRTDRKALKRLLHQLRSAKHAKGE
ncbi:MAG: hypothetical protein G01um101431_620 [Parcubacteria group bacterium Gr01-1014_31]|nr:MAG: hypothetical protein G01um101431_620 [Parcubacteria group bacterium Gr01-1014_31]